MRDTYNQHDSLAQMNKPGTQELKRSIVELACMGLKQMFIPERQLFCFMMRQDSDGRLRPQGVSHRYTMMTLLGLHRLNAAGFSSPVTIGPVLDELLRDLGWITSAGDLGLLLWTCAELAPERLGEVYSRVNLPAATRVYKDGRQRSTTELAWLLTGVSYAGRIAGREAWPYEAIAHQSYELLGANQGRHGIFGHVASERSIEGRLRGSIGSFADQVYPIYALSHFGSNFNQPEAISRARHCAEAIVRLQGAQGEWWWHYDANTGFVSRPYPVYSVHQDGMAPMALQALSRAAADVDFSKPIERGLGWIAGDNALTMDMRDLTHKLIWRCIALDSSSPALQEITYMITGRLAPHSIRDPHVNYQCRPYELGWALYAFADTLQISQTAE